MKIPNLSNIKTQDDLVQLIAKMTWEDNIYDIDDHYIDFDDDDNIYETAEEMTARSMLEYAINDSVNDYSKMEVIAYLCWIYSQLKE